MADDARHTVPPYDPAHARRQELIRPTERRRDFTSREAQRRLQQKERPHWALIAYAVFAAAVLLIFGVTYTTYAFSLYRGAILPGVQVDRTSLSGLSESQARKVLDNKLAAMYWKPVHLVSPVRVTSGPQAWDPAPDDIGYHPDVDSTVALAMQVGRHGSFVEQLLDRLPIHPTHSVPLIYPPVSDRQIQTYIQRDIRWHINVPAQNANLTVNPKTFHVDLIRSSPGVVLDLPRTIQTIHAALGSLSQQTKVLPVDHVAPVITNAAALRYRDRVERFLARPPVIAVGKRVFATSRQDFAPMFHFKAQPQVKQHRAIIVMIVNSDLVQAYVTHLANLIDRDPQNPKLDFSAGRVRVIRPNRLGRTLDQATANARLLAVIQQLKPNARLHIPVTITRPPVDTSNPASLGINSLLGTGETAFPDAGDTRLGDIRDIASRLQDVLIQPDQDISFNQLFAGTVWPQRVYVDKETDVSGQLIPGDGGAMQQVATTYFRALYNAGLKIVELHNHVYRLPWYEPPYGQDAVVSPSNKDLIFHNNTGKYLLLGTRLEPVRQELYIYVYGPKLNRQVTVDGGKIVKTYQHGPQIVKQDTSMAPGDVQYQAYAHDGADVVVRRTITDSHGNVTVEKLKVHYQPWQAIVVVGGSVPTATPTASPAGKKAKLKATPVPVKATPAAVTPTAAPHATPTPTFNH